MKFYILIFFIAVSSFLSCSHSDNDESKDSVIIQTEAVPENASILQLDNRLTEADSLVFVFYKDPHGKDSLRYTRFYKQYATIDNGLVKFVKNNLASPTTRFERVKKCRSEGKIWCFNKGDIFQTIYFSSLNEECSFLYIIKNGEFYYSTISKDMSIKLTELQSRAREPMNETE